MSISLDAFTGRSLLMLAWLGSMWVALPGCGRVSEVDDGSGGSATGSGGDTVMDGTGSSGGGGATSGSDGAGGHLVNNCPDLTGSSPPKKEIVPTYSDEPLPTSHGGEIPFPSEFVLTALRLKDSEQGLAIAADRALRFVSNEHVEEFHWDLANALAWRIEKETKLVTLRTCYVEGVGYQNSSYSTYDYTYADDVLTLVAPKKDPPEIYTYKRLKK